MDNHIKNTVEFIERKKDDVMMKLKKLLLLCCLLTVSVLGMAQENKVEMADTMRSNGRIYVDKVAVYQNLFHKYVTLGEFAEKGSF